MAHAKIRGLEGVQRSTWTRGCRGRGRYTHDYICTCFRLGTHTHTHGTLLLLGATEARALRAERFLTSLHFSLSRLVLLLPVPSSSLSRPRPCRPARLLRFSRSTGPPWPAWPSRFVPSAAVLGDLLENELECEHQPTCLRQREDIHVYCKDSYTWRIHIFIRGYTCLLQGQLTPLLPPPSRASWSSRQHWHTRSQRRTWNRWCARPGWASGPRYDTANRTRCSTCPARSW